MRSPREYAAALEQAHVTDLEQMTKARDREVRAAALEEAARAIEDMVVGGRAWTEQQELAARILMDISKGLWEMAKR